MSWNGRKKHAKIPLRSLNGKSKGADMKSVPTFMQKTGLRKNPRVWHNNLEASDLPFRNDDWEEHKVANSVEHKTPSRLNITRSILVAIAEDPTVEFLLRRVYEVSWPNTLGYDGVWKPATPTAAY
jgi:hypothetical protein